MDAETDELELGIRLLSLDGSHTDEMAALTQLLILREIMRRLEHDLGRTDLRPCEWFDLICGTGTGGLIAIMLGRLEMTIEETIEAYVALFPSTFTNVPAREASVGYRTNQLAQGMRRLTQARSATRNVDERLMPKDWKEHCNVFVCTMDSNNLTFPVLFRSYPVRANRSYNCTVNDAACATMAVPGRYHPVFMGEGITTPSYIAAIYGHNNPAELLLREARVVFPDSSISCIISIGSGHNGVTQMQSYNDLVPAVLRLSNDSEKVSQDIYSRFRNSSSWFFRLNVEQGMQWQSQTGPNRSAEVAAHTQSYLAHPQIDQMVNDVVESLHKRPSRISTELFDGKFKRSFRSVLEKLQPVEQAIYNATSPVPRRACTENTREEILKTFLSWALDTDDRKIYYLNGMAGTGKTTLAYTLCQMLEKMGFLGGTFFCSRADHSCSDATRIASTLASQLALFSPRFCNQLDLILEENAGRLRQNIDLRFNNLIAKPSRAATFDIKKTVVVVIDALDECRDQDYACVLLQNLWTYAARLPIKFFVTSRPERPFQDRIYGVDSVSTKFHLHNVELSFVERDIRRFIEERLRGFAQAYRKRHIPIPLEWPPEVQLETLTKQSGKLFIYAATACEYIGGGKLNIIQRLSSVIELGKHMPKGYTAPIDMLYSQILMEAYEGCDETEEESIKNLIGAIITAASPLPVKTIAELLHMEAIAVRIYLSLFHSVLNVPTNDGPVTTLHASFPDYLANSNRSQQFFVDPFFYHFMLSRLSFDLMSSNLQGNICQRSGFPDNRTLPVTVMNENISSALSYACNYWSIHVRSAGDFETVDVSLMEQVSIFFKRQSLFWVECLSYVGGLYRSIQLLRDLENWVPKVHTDLCFRIMDARLFISQNIDLLSVNALETYNSALLWLPLRSHIWQRFSSGRMLPCIVTGKTLDWDSCEMILAGHPDQIWVVAFSPNGDRIVSAACDGALRVWNATTGKLEHILKGHFGTIGTLSFCPDGFRIVSGAEDQDVRVWNVVTGELEHRFDGHSSHIWTTSFSPDGTRIASGSRDKTVRVWNVVQSTGNTSQRLIGHTGAVESVAFSPDGSQIASGSDDRNVHLWNAITGQLQCILMGHTDDVRTVVYSPCGARIASGSDDKAVHVWNTYTGVLELKLFGHSAEIRTVTFSPNGLKIVSGSYDKTLRIWDARTGATEQILNGHSGFIRSCTFSRNGALIVSSSQDSTVRLWNATTGESKQIFNGHSDDVISTAFSPDGIRIASGSDDGTVRVWDTSARNSEPEPTVTGHLLGGIQTVAFSPAGDRIAAGSYGRLEIWNVTTGQSEHEFTSDSQVEGIIFSLDGARIAYGSYNCPLRVGNISTGRIEHEFFGYFGGMGSVAFSPESARIVFGFRDKTLRLWKIPGTFADEFVLTGHSGYIRSVAFSADGTRIVSAADDHTVRVWNSLTGSALNEFTGPLSLMIDSVKFFSDGIRIGAYYPYDTSTIVRVWNTRSGELELGSRKDYVESILSKYSDNNPGLPSSIQVELTEDLESEHRLFSARQVTEGETPSRNSLLRLSGDRRWLIHGSKKYWIPPKVADFRKFWSHSNIAVLGYNTGKLVIIAV